MGFDNPPSTGGEAEVSVKVSYGNEIRRFSVSGGSYASLCERTANLFLIDPATLVIKYHDDDEDKISMSTDAEFQEAIRLSKQMQKILRLFVEVRVPEKKLEQQSVPSVPKSEPAAESNVYLGPGGGRFGFSRGPFPPHPHPHPPYHHPHSHPHPPYHPAASTPALAPSPSPFPSSAAAPAPPHFGPPGFSAFYPGGAGFAGSNPSAGTEEGKHYGPDHHRHHQYRRNRYGYASQGAFPSASSTATATASSSAFPSSTAAPSPSGTFAKKQQIREELKAYKENKRAMKQKWREMKLEASTEEEKKALKELKMKMKEEMRSAKSDFKQDLKCDRDAMRAARQAGKKPKFVARHVEDVTIPDGTELPPSTPFIKTWKIRNEGPAWPTGSQLLFISHKGDNLNGPERVVIKGEVLPWQEVEVSVPLITPSEPGRYVGYYRMVTPDGIKFGQRVWVSFTVKAPATTTATTTTTTTNAIPSTPTPITTTTSSPTSPSVAQVCDQVDV